MVRSAVHGGALDHSDCSGVESHYDESTRTNRFPSMRRRTRHRRGSNEDVRSREERRAPNVHDRRASHGVDGRPSQVRRRPRPRSACDCVSHNLTLSDAIIDTLEPFVGADPGVVYVADRLLSELLDAGWTFRIRTVGEPDYVCRECKQPFQNIGSERKCPACPPLTNAQRQRKAAANETPEHRAARQQQERDRRRQSRLRAKSAVQ